jgi:hypothetical protein
MAKKQLVKKDQSMVNLHKHLRNDNHQVTNDGIYLGDGVYLLDNGEII